MAPKTQQPDFLELYRALGRIEGTMKAIDEKLDKSIQDSCERLCNCEDLLKDHSEYIANSKGKLTVWGLFGGLLASIGIAIINWLITNKVL
jgi:hypothetical protein